MPSTSCAGEDLSAPIGDVSVTDGRAGGASADGRAGASLRALKSASKVKIHGLIMPSPGGEAGGSENVPRRDISGGESRVSSVGRMLPTSGKRASQFEIELLMTTELSAH